MNAGKGTTGSRKSELGLPKGIHNQARGKKFGARLVIKHSKKGTIVHYIGSYDTVEEAKEAREKWILSLI